MKLVIVESPTKAKTITRFLGKGFSVMSSNGHVRDLPQKRLGVDLKNDFEPQYTILTKAKENVKKLKKEADKAELIILATDEDREGEAIAWHLISALKIKSEKKYQRIVFHEITPKAIEVAIKNPRDLDIRLVDSQQGRRILDRLVGYKLSPFLWKKIAKGLSAGRVQSVAVRLIVEREREIKNFQPEEYWSIEALLKKQKDDLTQFTAALIEFDKKSITKMDLKNKETADQILAALKQSQYQVLKIEKKETVKNPLPPFITSTLQQDAAKKLGYSAKFTMRVAQELYEGVELGKKDPVGLITYMRTDSFNLSSDAVSGVRDFIKKQLGPKYLPPKPVFYKTKSKGAQEAHEAIRPTDTLLTPDSIKNHLSSQQYKLYNLIWCRFVTCQMEQAIMDSTSIDILAQAQKQGIFRATGLTLKFDGWLKIYPTKFQETNLPLLTEKEILDLIKLEGLQHFTQAPARFTEAMLIKTLEKHGVGRPSTYAPIISTIQNRGYVMKNEQKRFEPTEIGFKVTDILIQNFPQIIDIEFTARMEEDLDDIADGKIEWKKIIKEFYGPFEKNLLEKYESVKTQKVEEPTDKICPKCGSKIVIKQSRFGKFYACSNFPNCRHTESILVKTGVKCPKCQKGDVIERRSKRGRVFFGCSQYPKCDFSLWDKPNGQKCPQCQSLMVETKTKKTKCSNPDCPTNASKIKNKKEKLK
jgi:DNA topoisomerase-1